MEFSPQIFFENSGFLPLKNMTFSHIFSAESLPAPFLKIAKFIRALNGSFIVIVSFEPS